jgi:hypothetical protein
MIEIKGNLWDFWDHDHVICITTNGFVKRNGQAVMGRGCALEATQRVPGIAEILGDTIRRNGNHVSILTDKHLPLILSFPVKHNWWEEADLYLIERSAWELVEFVTNSENHKTFVLPRPGCGNGRLRWETVKAVIEPILPDWVQVISF